MTSFNNGCDWEVKGYGVERGGTGVERGGTGIEKGGSGIEKGGSGIEKGGSGIARGGIRRLALSGLLVIGVGFGGTGAVFADAQVGMSPMSSWDAVGDFEGSVQIQQSANGTAKVSMLVKLESQQQLMLIGSGKRGPGGLHFQLHEIVSNADLELKAVGIHNSYFGEAYISSNSCSSMSVELFVAGLDKTTSSGSGSGKTTSSGSGSEKTTSSGSGSDKTTSSGSGSDKYFDANLQYLASADLFALSGGSCDKTTSSGSGS